MRVHPWMTLLMGPGGKLPAAQRAAVNPKAAPQASGAVRGRALGRKRAVEIPIRLHVF